MKLSKAQFDLSTVSLEAARRSARVVEDSTEYYKDGSFCTLQIANTLQRGMPLPSANKLVSHEPVWGGNKSGMWWWMRARASERNLFIDEPPSHVRLPPLQHHAFRTCVQIRFALLPWPPGGAAATTTCENAPLPLLAIDGVD